MARRPIPAFSLSLLDLLCCAFGAVIVLAVIFAASVKPPPASSPEPRLTVLLKASAQGPWPFEPDTFVLGLRVAGPGSSVRLQRSNEPDTSGPLRYRWSRSNPKSDQPYLILTIEGAAPGTYQIEPTLPISPAPSDFQARAAHLLPLEIAVWSGAQPVCHMTATIAQGAVSNSFGKYAICLPGPDAPCAKPCP